LCPPPLRGLPKNSGLIPPFFFRFPPTGAWSTFGQDFFFGPSFVNSQPPPQPLVCWFFLKRPLTVLQGFTLQGYLFFFLVIPFPQAGPHGQAVPTPASFFFFLFFYAFFPAVLPLLCRNCWLKNFVSLFSFSLPLFNHPNPSSQLLPSFPLLEFQVGAVLVGEELLSPSWPFLKAFFLEYFLCVP